MPCYQLPNLPGGVTTTGRTSYTTEAECNQACKEGACCEGTTCTVKPQCQCQGAGKVFKGVGTVCANGICTPCCKDITKLPSSLTVTLSNWRAITCAQRGSGGGVLGAQCTQVALDFAKTLVDHAFVLSQRQLMLSDLNSCKIVYSTPASSGQCVFAGDMEILLTKNTSVRGANLSYSCTLPNSTNTEKRVGANANLFATTVPTLDDLCNGTKTFPATYESGVAAEYVVFSQEVFVITSTANIKIEAAFNPLP
jgi:hypothetical protein